MKPGLLQPATLVRVGDDATLTVCEPARTTPVGEMQVASVMFHLSGVDQQAFLSGSGPGPPSRA